MKYTNPIIKGADPFVLMHEGKYYLYSTNYSEGYKALESDNLTHWSNESVVLHKDNVMGEKDFWAPEVIFYGGKFYMIYTAETHIGVAVSDSPMGPFVQHEKKWAAEFEAIDGHFFLDDDGKMYLYYVKFGDEYGIYVAEMSDDMTEIKPQTEKFLLRSSEEWETKNRWYLKDNVLCGISEGPFVLKNNAKYYLTYSANDYQNQDYSVGCAVSDSPMGPFEKCSGNPILSKCGEFFGTGHHSFTRNKDTGSLICVYHCHNSIVKVHPRMVCIDSAEFITDNNGNEILKINGPSKNGVLK